MLSHEKLLSFIDLRDEVIRLLLNKQCEYEGTIVSSIPKLSEITKGFRRGELVVFTGLFIV